MFVDTLITHLQACRVFLDGYRIQTDNGSEFMGAWNAKKDSIFAKTIQSVKGLVHQTIPPAAHTWQADVETDHRLIKDAFYEVETFSSRDNFPNKATTYNPCFNSVRKNSYKINKTPWEIIHERNESLDPNIVTLKPFFLDDLLYQKFDSIASGRGDVVPHP